jgi:hypothetical protein
LWHWLRTTIPTIGALPWNLSSAKLLLQPRDTFVQFAKVVSMQFVEKRLPATILYHTSCYNCFARYKKSFENPQSFWCFIAGSEKNDLHVDDEEEQIASPSILDKEVEVVENGMLPPQL